MDYYRLFKIGDLAPHLLEQNEALGTLDLSMWCADTSQLLLRPIIIKDSHYSECTVQAVELAYLDIDAETNQVLVNIERKVTAFVDSHGRCWVDGYTYYNSNW